MLRASAAAALLLAAAVGGAAHGAPTRRAHAKAPAKADAAASADASDYARDQIVVSTEGRSRTQNPTATCLVWADAEGLGVGPAELGGLHGVSFTLVANPLPGESPKSFAQGMADAKTAYPAAPDWLMRTLTAQKGAIETACGEDHPDPVTVHRITRADMR